MMSGLGKTLQISTSMKVLIVCIVATAVYYTAQAEQPRMELQISTKNNMYHLGEQILINVERCYHNLTTPLQVTGYNAGAAAELDTKFSVTDQDGAAVEKTDRAINGSADSSLMHYYVLNNNCDSEVAIFESLYKFKAPRLYVIRATSAISPKLGGGVAESNELTIEIEK